MLKNVNLPRVLRGALRHGGDLSEVFYEESASTLVLCEDNRIERAVTGEDIGAGVRIAFKGRTGYAYTNDASEKGLIEAARAASEAASGRSAARTIRLTERSP